MPKKSRLKTLMDSQRVKASETLLKSARQYFCHIFLLLKEIQLEKFSFSSIWNPETVC